MGISVNTSKQQVTASVNDETVSATVSAGFGSSGAAGQAATIAVGAVTTGAPGSSAAVVNSGSSSAAVFDFTIPAGATGPAGPQGPAGSTNPSDIVTSTTYSNFLPSGGSLATAYSGIDSAIGAKADASDFDQGLKTTDSPTFAGLSVNVGLDQVLGTDNGPGVIFPNSATFNGFADFSNCTVVGLSYNSLDDLPTLGTAAAASTSDFAAASHAHSATDVTSGTFDIARIPTGTTSTTVSLGNHTHSQLHDRSHAITSSSDHTATAWRLFYSNGSGAVTELTFGNSGQALISNGASAAPSWGSAGSNSASDLTTGTLANARMTTRARASMNLYLWSSFR